MLHCSEFKTTQGRAAAKANTFAAHFWGWGDPYGSPSSWDALPNIQAVDNTALGIEASLD